MNWNEMRTVWLVTRGGVFEELRMALVARPADLASFMPQDPKPGESGSKRWAALSAGEVAEGGWDAHPTKWPKRLPPGMVRGVGTVATLAGEGRAWEGGGLRYRLDDGGRAHPRPDATPLAPAVEVIDAARLAAHLARPELAGVELVERGTLQPVRVQGRGPA